MNTHAIVGEFDRTPDEEMPGRGPADYTPAWVLLFVVVVALIASTRKEPPSAKR